MKKLGAGIIALLLKIGPKIMSVGTKLLKSAKVVKGTLFVGSFVGYSYLFTWQFALIILVSTFIHEYGHIFAMKRCGLKTKGIYFIPFVGAAAVSDGIFTERKDECYIAIMGPIFGLVMVLIMLGIYYITKNEFIGASAGWIAFVNLFNLLPITPLDGGRIFKSAVISTNKSLGLIIMLSTVILCMIICISVGLFLFGFLALVGLLEFLYERHRCNKVPKKLNNCLYTKDRYEVVQHFCDTHKDQEIEFLLQDEMKRANVTNARDLRDIVSRLIKNNNDEMEKLQKDLPPERLTPKQILVWSSFYIVLTGILWSIMNLISHIPGIDIAKQIMSA